MLGIVSKHQLSEAANNKRFAKTVMQQFKAGTVDAVVQSDDKPYISPAVHLRTFLAEATAADEGLRDFFRDTATKKRRAAALAKQV